MLYAFFRLTRPINGLIASISVISGAFLSGGSINSIYNIAIVAIGAFLLTGAGNSLNDFWDVESDKINKPLRPIPLGQIKRQWALVFAISLFVIGSGLGLLVSWKVLVFFSFVSAVLVLYTIKMRRFLLIGNISIGFLTGLTLIAGGMAAKSLKGAFIPAIFAFFITVAREIIKDIQDVKGDKISGLTSLPLRLGIRKAMYISLVFLASIIIISPWPYIIGFYSLYYLISIIGIDLILLYCAFMLFTKLTEKTAARVSGYLKINILLGLGALYLGKL